jgi:hypothetical protein
MAVVVVLGLLSITLALSYSMLRTQVTCAQIQSNSLRRSSAQMAAMAGIQDALRSISEPGWAGVGLPITGNLSNTESYSVTIETGDASLTPSHPDYAEYPYRLTLISTGLAENAADSNQQSIHHLRVVVQLVRRKLADPPSGWSQVVPHTVYQWSNQDVDYELPVRIEGSCYLQGRLRLCQQYPNGDAKSQYLGDLELMRVAGFPDHRPFDGPVYLPFSRNPHRSLLVNELNLSVYDIPSSNSPPFAHTGNISTYRLYPGGQEYVPQALSSSLSATTLGPDPVTNPLGVYTRHGTVRIGDNVTVQGLLATWGHSSGTDVYIDGNNVTFEAVQLPPLVDDSNTYELPAVASKDDIYMENHSSGSIKGVVYAGDDYEVLHAYTDVQLHLTGKLVCRELQFKPNETWHLLNWISALSEFKEQGATAYFPQWVEQNRGLASNPMLTVKPDTSGVIHHWHDWTQPLFVPHPDDGGLRWEVIDWRDEG